MDNKDKANKAKRKQTYLGDGKWHTFGISNSDKAKIFELFKTHIKPDRIQAGNEIAIHEGCKDIIKRYAETNDAWLNLTPELQTMDSLKYRDLYNYLSKKFE